jgi:hypothetical protein
MPHHVLEYGVRHIFRAQCFSPFSGRLDGRMREHIGDAVSVGLQFAAIHKSVQVT